MLFSSDYTIFKHYFTSWRIQYETCLFTQLLMKGQHLGPLKMSEFFNDSSRIKNVRKWYQESSKMSEKVLELKCAVNSRKWRSSFLLILIRWFDGLFRFFKFQIFVRHFGKLTSREFSHIFGLWLIFRHFCIYEAEKFRIFRNFLTFLKVTKSKDHCI